MARVEAARARGVLARLVGLAIPLVRLRVLHHLLALAGEALGEAGLAEPHVDRLTVLSLAPAIVIAVLLATGGAGVHKGAKVLLRKGALDGLLERRREVATQDSVQGGEVPPQSAVADVSIIILQPPGGGPRRVRAGKDAGDVSRRWLVGAVREAHGAHVAPRAARGSSSSSSATAADSRR